MLIFAQRLVDMGVWAVHYSPRGATYGQRAQDVLDNFWATGMIDQGRFVAPAPGWGGAVFVNPGYFAPAWYRVFAAVDSNPAHDWASVIAQCYDTWEASPGYDKGLVPDWMAPYGAPIASSQQALGYNAYMGGAAMYKDAIRAFWRAAVDAVWFDEPRARAFLERAHAFLESVGGPAKANFFQMDGREIPQEDVWVFAGGSRTRSRNEHSILTTSQWAMAAFGAHGPAAAEPYVREMLTFYAPGNTFWGLERDPRGGLEDVQHAEMYFEQFLGWFGAALLDGHFVNVAAAFPV